MLRISVGFARTSKQQLITFTNIYLLSKVTVNEHKSRVKSLACFQNSITESVKIATGDFAFRNGRTASPCCELKNVQLCSGAVHREKLSLV